MRKLIDINELLKHSHDVTLLNGAKHRCIDATVIHEIPTVDAVPVRHGKWIRDEFGARCGVCGLYAYRDKFDQPWESPYCPNCGAKMERKDADRSD